MDLDTFLNPTNSPFALNQKLVDPYTFDYQNERGIVGVSQIGSATIQTANIANGAITNVKIGTAAIGTANIGTLSFNEITGGTATLGGTSNGNGLLRVNNAGGTQIVTINNQGIQVTGGSISISNTSGSIVLDSNGLVSKNNFYVEGRNVVGTSFSTTSMVDWSGTEMDIVATSPRYIMVVFSGPSYLTESGGNTGNAELQIYFSQTQSGAYSCRPYVYLNSGNNYSTTRSLTLIEQVPIGTTTIKMRGRFNLIYAGTPVLNTGASSFTYFTLGF